MQGLASLPGALRAPHHDPRPCGGYRISSTSALACCAATHPHALTQGHLHTAVRTSYCVVAVPKQARTQGSPAAAIRFPDVEGRTQQTLRFLSSLVARQIGLSMMRFACAELSDPLMTAAHHPLIA